MNEAIRRWDASFIIPTLQVVWLVFSVISGGIFFREFLTLSPFQTAMFTLGMVLLVTSVLFLAPVEKPKVADVDEFEFDDSTEGWDDFTGEPARRKKNVLPTLIGLPILNRSKSEYESLNIGYVSDDEVEEPVEYH